MAIMHLTNSEPKAHKSHVETVKDSAGAPACEIEITDEMIDAGQAVADGYDSRFERPGSLVISIYRAMAALAPRPKVAPFEACIPPS